MPSCIKCGQDNPGSTRFCQKCGAMLPQMAPTGMPGDSSLDLDEDTNYLTPQYRYFSEAMHHLSWSAHDFLEEGAPLGPFLEAFEEVKNNFYRFQADDLPRLQESITEQRVEWADDQYPRQVAYLNTKGVTFYEEGISKIDTFLGSLNDPDGANPDHLIDGITRILDGNDHFCLCIELCQARMTAIEAYMKTGRLPNAEELTWLVAAKNENDAADAAEKEAAGGQKPAAKAGEAPAAVPAGAEEEEEDDGLV